MTKMGENLFSKSLILLLKEFINSFQKFLIQKACRQFFQSTSFFKAALKGLIFISWAGKSLYQKRQFLILGPLLNSWISMVMWLEFIPKNNIETGGC